MGGVGGGGASELSALHEKKREGGGERRKQVLSILKGHTKSFGVGASSFNHTGGVCVGGGGLQKTVSTL